MSNVRTDLFQPTIDVKNVIDEGLADGSFSLPSLEYLLSVPRTHFLQAEEIYDFEENFAAWYINATGDRSHLKSCDWSFLTRKYYY